MIDVETLRRMLVSTRSLCDEVSKLHKTAGDLARYVAMLPGMDTPLLVCLEYAEQNPEWENQLRAHHLAVMKCLEELYVLGFTRWETSRPVDGTE